jgi:hypothetical protein
LTPHNTIEEKDDNKKQDIFFHDNKKIIKEYDKSNRNFPFAGSARPIGFSK